MVPGDQQRMSFETIGPGYRKEVDPPRSSNDVTLLTDYSAGYYDPSTGKCVGVFQKIDVDIAPMQRRRSSHRRSYVAVVKPDGTVDIQKRIDLAVIAGESTEEEEPMSNASSASITPVVSPRRQALTPVFIMDSSRESSASTTPAGSPRQHVPTQAFVMGSTHDDEEKVQIDDSMSAGSDWVDSLSEGDFEEVEMEAPYSFKESKTAELVKPRSVSHSKLPSLLARMLHLKQRFVK